jgi:hypothetical protein
MNSQKSIFAGIRHSGFHRGDDTRDLTETITLKLKMGPGRSRTQERKSHRFLPSPECRDSQFLVRLSGFLALQPVFLLEPLHPSGRIDQFLFTGKERMAPGADFDRNLLLDGFGADFIAAGAFDDRIDVLGMNVLFHLFLRKKAVSHQFSAINK